MFDQSCAFLFATRVGLMTEGLEYMATFIGQGPPMRLFDRHVKQSITVRFIQRHVSGRGNVATITNRCVKLFMYFKDSMPRTLNISHTFENTVFS